MRPNGELPSDHSPDRRRQTSELRRKPISRFILPPRAQAARRQAALAFRSLDPFRALREPDRRRRDEEPPFPLRTKNCEQNPKNNRLTGKTPYKSTEVPEAYAGQAPRAKERLYVQRNRAGKARLSAIPGAGQP